MPKKTTEQFIQQLKEIHGDKYDYSKVKYTGQKAKIIIICKKCGEFTSTGGALLDKRTKESCPTCSRRVPPRPRLLSEEIIKSFNKIHGYKYDYSNVKYTGIDNKVIIICPIHGEFRQTPYCHRKGQGCVDCGRTKQGQEKHHKWITETFFKKAHEIHGDKYDYSKISADFKSKDKITIICNKCNEEFNPTANNLLRGKGCPRCAGRIFSNNEFIEKAQKKYGDKYDYAKVEYIHCKKKITITCRIHGDFSQTPDSHLNVRSKNQESCPKCLLCPTCELWRTLGGLCGYCDPNSKKGKQLREKTKEMEIVKYLRNELPDDPFYHNVTVGSDCTKDDRENTNGHLYPDVRFDCDTFQLIVEIDEFRHRGSDYKCDERRMYDIIAKLGMRCVFIRYNPDSAETNKIILLKLVKNYLQNPKIEFNSFGLKTEYLFY